MKRPFVYLVGAGPGDARYITVRGLELLGRADVVVYDYLASPSLLDCAPAAARRICAGKRSGGHSMPQEQINRLIVDEALAGNCVVRLKGGDPFIFGRGAEECEALEAKGVPFEVVPGITAGIGAGACAGIPLTDRRFSSAVAFITGHEADEKEGSSIDWELLGRWKGTLVFYMGVGNVEPIMANLLRHGLDAQTPAAAVQWAATARQQVIQATVEELAEKLRQSNMGPPAVLIVGEVVKLRGGLEWFQRRPMFGKRIVVTRARAQASKLVSALEELGAQTIEVPTIRIEPLADNQPLVDAVSHIGVFNWIVFTSANAVDPFMQALLAGGGDARSIGKARIAAIGPATADALLARSLRADVTPDEHTTPGLVAAMASVEDLAGRSVLCPRSDIAPNDLVDLLTARDAKVTNVHAYRTVRESNPQARICDLLSARQVDWLTFTSSSTVVNLMQDVSAQAVQASGVKIASIGPATSAAVQQHGLHVTAQASECTIDGLVDAIVRHEAQYHG